MPRQDQEEISFLRTDDYVCLSCVAHGQSDRSERLCLAAGGFGNRMCFFENVSYSDSPADLSVCVFLLEQALSVRALQEMVSTNQTEGSAHSGHRTLLYGHAILLRHLQSNMYLSCLSTCSSTDKLAFDVGLQENSHAESCWWTIHPASKQRSEGEKVRIGDDLILVSVSSERYLHLTTCHSTLEHNVQASFQQTLWSVIPGSSGTARQKALGMVLGGDVLRLFHGDECLTVPVTESEGSPATGSMHQHNYESSKQVVSDNRAVMYEMGAVCTHARSLWRLEHIKLKWSGGFMSWGSACRLRHVTSGRYLALQGNELVVVHRTEASEEACAFVLLQSKDDKIRREERDDEGMGSPDLKFGESMAFLQHRATGRWLSYQTFETKKRGLGRVEEKRAVLLAEGHMDDGLTMTRAQDEESNAAVAIRRCASLFTRFIKGLEALQAEGPRSTTWSRISMAEVLRCLEDLIAFFIQPAPTDDHDTRQEKLKALRNRQDLFQEEGMIGLVLTTINAFSGGRFNSKREFAQAVGEDRADFYDQIGNCLYLLLAAMIRGNQANCAQFAHSSRLDWLFNRLESQQSAEGVLDALHCVLTDSQQALNMIREEHIQTLIRLLDKQGRDPKVLEVLCSLCAGVRSGAVRVNQDLICDNLLTERDLLLQTRLVDYSRSMRPNIFVGLSEGGAIYKRWYYEVVIDSVETITNNSAKLRIGWANTDGYTPHPGGGVGWGALSLGDDLFSFGFDGQSLWTAGKPKRVCNIQQRLKRGDVIGCFLDLSTPRIGFSVNGNAVKGFFQAFNTTGMFFPCISMSAKVSVRFVFGGTQGKLKFGPPDGHAPIAEALMPRDRLRIDACFNLGTPEKGTFCGPTEPRELAVFIPTPVDTVHIQLNENIEAVRDKLAVNLHELWAMRKIEQGWTFGDRRDDHKRRHPCLTSFDRLPSSERHYNVTLAFETLRTIIALGYHVSYEPIPGKEGTQPRVVKLNNNYLQSNGYKPSPLELSAVHLSDRLEELVEALAENTHNVWARDRIRQGWTYGATEDIHNKRSPHLVPYSRVDDFIKQSNRVTATETVKTMIAYNYSIESPVADNADAGRNRKAAKTKILTRTFRVQTTWAVSSGKWYYEAEVLSSGFVRLGWSQSNCTPNVDVGTDAHSYAFECSQARKWHQESAPYGKVCQPGDVIGCMLDLQDCTITFSLNGELMMDPLGQEIAFKGIEKSDSEHQYVPAFTLGSGQQIRVNFGNDVHSLKYFTCCGLQEGFQPFCVNMSRSIPLWYSRQDASLFKDVTSLHPNVEVMRTTDSTPCLKIVSKTYGNIQRDDMDFLRLSLPVKCKDHFISRSLAERRNELEALHRQLVPPPSAKGMNTMMSDDYMIKTHSAGKRLPPVSVSQNDLLNGGPVGSTAGGSLLEIPDKRGSSKRSKSPFSLFKKVARSRETSPEAPNSRMPRGGLRTGNRSAVQRSVEVEPPNAADIKIYTQFAGSDESAEIAADLLARENSIAEHMEEYCFSVRVLPGQEPNAVYVGWVTANFKITNLHQSSTPEVRQAVVCQLDVDYRPKPGCSEKSAYIMNAGELLARYGTPEDASKRMSQGLLVTCWLDAASGTVGFDLNGREIANKFQVEPLTRLYPAVFARPTAREMVAVEFSRTRHSLSVLSAMTRPPKLAQPHLHPRLTVQSLEKSYWARVPENQLRVYTLKLSEVRGWSMLCEEPIQMMAVHVPEHDRCLDVLELEENPTLLRFHAHSLELYRSLSRHGNHRVSHILTTHVDDKQLMHTIQCSNLSGPIRMGFFNLLIAMHLETHKDLMELTQKEFVLPLATEESVAERRHHRRPSIFDMSEEKACAQFNEIPSVESFGSIRPTLMLDPAVCKDLGRPISDNDQASVGVTRHMLGIPPPFPLARLKDQCILSLLTAVNLGSHIRDPIGGSNAYLFVPLLRVADCMLVMGLFDAKDMKQLLSILDPKTFGCQTSWSMPMVTESLLAMPVEEDVKLELCHLLHHLTDLQLRHQIETLVEFSNMFCVEVQNDQLRRYLEIKQSNLPSSVTAKKTREFRCPPNEQMRSMVNFQKEVNGELPFDHVDTCPCREDLKRVILLFHENLMRNCGVEREEEEKSSDMTGMQGLSGSRELIPLEGGLAVWAPIGGPTGDPESGPGLLGRRNIFKRLLECVWKKASVETEEPANERPRTFATLVVDTIVNWARESFIENLDLVRDMFSLLHRQYDTLGEITAALDKTYIISDTAQEDLNKMMRALGTVRNLLGVQVGPTEEEALKACLWEIMDNKVFFQHPNLMRCLAVHETVMQLMVHTLTKTSLDPVGTAEVAESGKGVDEGAADMVVMCCRFLCYFCRTSGENQKAMFDHLSYMLENSSMLLARPSLRGSCPLDVAYSSLMDNNELALMLRESQLEKVAIYLSRCGVQSNAELLMKGYPDIGWDPVEGERFLDFLRFTVWVNGESVEENANLVVRLLIRRPECLGPALRGGADQSTVGSESGGLLKAMKEGIMMSAQIALANDEDGTLTRLLADYEDAHVFSESPYEFSGLPPEDDEDYIDLGAAMLTFYSVLVDLLGRCAPEADTTKPDSVRVQSILRSLVSLSDLEGVISLRFILLPARMETVVNEEGESEVKDMTGLPPGLLPEHKAAVVLFLERVYGITEASTFLRLLENGFLPDMRTATVLDMGSSGESDMALALNRYLCNSVLPLLTKHAHFLAEEVEQAGDLMDATLHTTYRLSKCNSLTKGQRDIVSEFLVALTKQLQPHMMTRLLRKLAYDVPSLSPQSVVPLRLLTVYYERCGRYFGTGGWSGHGCASEEERHVTSILFTRIFDSLALRPYDPELFSMALPCLCAIGCALSPDYSSVDHSRGGRIARPSEKNDSSRDSVFVPLPADTSRISIGPDLARVVDHFAQHFHDSWALELIEQGWIFGNTLDGGRMTHPNLRPYHMLQTRDQHKYSEPIQECLKAMVSWGWRIEREDPVGASEMRIADRRRPTVIMESPHGYTPTPRDLRNISLTRDVLTMSEKLAENAHNCWAKRKQEDLEDLGGAAHHQLVPYDILTEREKSKYRKLALELLKYLQTEGFRVSSSHLTHADELEGAELASNSPSNAGAIGAGGGSLRSTERRFAYRLLVKLLEYVERVVVCVKQGRPSDRYARSKSFAQAPEDMKFFGKVVLPLVEKYFDAHKLYFVGPHSLATAKEKEYATSLFCKLFSLLRQKMMAFGHDVNISVRCLQGLVHALDFRTLVKNQSVVRVFLLPFFTYCAEDLSQVVHNLSLERFSHLKGTINRGATSLNYIYMVLLPVLKGIFEHLGSTQSGDELLVGDIQVACYRILNGLYVLGTCSSQHLGREQLAAEFERHRPLLGECVAAFASTFPVAFLEPHFNKFNKNSISYGIQGDLGEHSLEAREVMSELSKTLPTLEKIVDEIADLAESGGKYTEAPHVIEVTLPMLCSYLPFWWARGADNEDSNVTSVTTCQMNTVLGNVLKLIRNNIESQNAPWMTRIATRTQPIVANAPDDMLALHFLPVATKLQEHALAVEREEEQYQAEKRSGMSADLGEAEERLQEKVEMLVRNMFAFYPLLIRYVDRHRTNWIKQPTLETGQLFSAVASMFLIWSKSSLLKRAEQNFVCQNEIDHLALIMPGQSNTAGSTKKASSEGGSSTRSNEDKKKEKGQGPAKRKLENFTSLNVACIKRLLPIGLSLFGGREQELVQKAKQKLINECCVRDDHLWLELSVQKENEAEIEEYLRTVMEEEEDNANISNKWQKVLYKKIGQAKLASVVNQLTRQNLVDKVINLAKVLHALYLVDHPPSSSKSAWKKLISSQRKRAVMACFRMLPIHALPRHKVVNLFLESYKDIWLTSEESPDVKLIDALTSEDEMDPANAAEGGGSGNQSSSGGEGEANVGSSGKGDPGLEVKPDPLKQLITALSRSAESQAEDDPLYIRYANIMGKSCSGEDDDDDDEGGDEDAGVSFQEQEMQKQQLLAEQGRLANRGAAEMILLEISACKGEVTEVVKCTIELGIAVLLGGNVDVQAKMLNYLKEKKDVGFFTSMAGLMQQCSVLDLDAFERSNKAEGLGVSDADHNTGNTNLSDAEFTCKLFRFLQLLAEGHNLAFQDYLRSQAGNTTTVNIIICTVDYLLRLQESIMDFYWHYSGKDKIDEAGKKNFCRAIKVGKQVFCTLTEDIQGPCVGNQLALAHSRLWDAISGFLYIFANMQEKLSKDPDQLELLREFMNLQKEMMIMLLSMLEGNVVNGPIGKQMVDTLVESSANVEMILKFFDIFLRMKDITSSEAFLAFDINGDGWISHKEFRSAMESQKMYSEEEIEYIMMCVDANHDGKVDFNEFTERFHNPAKDIGFNLAVLLTNLYEHMPNDPRLERLIGKAKRVLDTFEPYLGRIEIMGSNARIERVYFEIRQSHIDQWEKPQIKESKRSFLHSIVNEGGDKEKLESFTNFCEDSIFEMQHAQAISGEGEGLKLSQVAAVRRFLDSDKVQLASRCWQMLRGGMSYLTPSNLRHGWGRFRAMTPAELILALGRGQLKIVIMILSLLWHLTRSMGSVIGAMMRGDPDADKAWEPQVTLQEQQPWLLSEEQQLAIEHLDTTELALLDEHYHATSHGLDTGANCTVGSNTAAIASPQCVHQPNGQGAVHHHHLDAVLEPTLDHSPTTMTLPRSVSVLGASATPTSTLGRGTKAAETTATEATSASPAAESEEEEVTYEVKTIDTSTYVLSLFARNFYQFKICALVLAFVINFTLLFYRVSQATESASETPVPVANVTVNATDAGAAGGDDEVDEWVSLPDSVSYCQTLLRMIAVLHTAMSFSMLVAYCCLKVPLVIFKREKEVSRMLEFDGMWISEQPSEEDIKAHWDKLVLSTPSFPQMYWDKFVKKKVRTKYSEQYDDEEIIALLGMQDATGPDTKDAPGRSFIPQWLSDMDLRYQLWKWGVIFTDNSFLYLVMYFVASVIGNYNYFFFACHLLDVAIGFKTLRTILQSVTHNGKQLVLTVILTSIIIYLYTVIAFNFFRKFYVKDNDGVKDAKCHDMLTCFVFHLHTGLRAGGGIGDEIESPDGDPYEVYRILFDITFFFFVIVILLAIIQGLIIDAFGELRDQLEQVKEDLESKCFICGIGKEYFDKVPHGFEKHVEKEHNFANYMFFIMHLINKPDTEYTGQETYVWELYQQRSWDFFPVGDCFRKQYEDQLSG